MPGYELSAQGDGSATLLEKAALINAALGGEDKRT